MARPLANSSPHEREQLQPVSGPPYYVETSAIGQSDQTIPQ
jgi:hypothetical protein